MNEIKTAYLPRSQVFAVWRKLTDASPQSIERMASEVFPRPLSELAWTVVVSEKSGDEMFGLFLAAPLPVKDGTCLRFVAVWKWLLAVRPDMASKEAVAVIDVGSDEREVTLLHKGFPLFCGTTGIEDVLAHVRRAHRLSLEQISETVYAPAGAVESAVALTGIEAIPWLRPPQERLSPVARFWRRHKTNALATAAVIFMVGGVVLQSRVDDREMQLRKLTRELRSEGTASPGGRQRSAIAPGQALEALAEAARRAPAASHLLSFRYDAAGATVLIDGRAADYAIVSDYVTALSKAPLFRDVRSERSRLEQMDGRSVVAFSLKAALR